MSESKKLKRKLSDSKVINRKKSSEASIHKHSLDKLKETDPEFYRFLNAESKELLNFSASESDDDANTGQNKVSKKSIKQNTVTNEIIDNLDDADSDDDDDDIHKPPQKLLEQSDSDEEEPEVPAKRKKDSRELVTVVMVKNWTKRMQKLTNPSTDDILKDAVDAFCAAVHQAGTKNTKDVVSTKYKVEGSTVFNAVVRMLITEFHPTLARILQLPKSKRPNKHPSPTQSKVWTSVKSTVRLYLGALLKLTSSMAEAGVINVLLKHIFQSLSYFAVFPKLLKLLLRQLIAAWCHGEESTRVLAFFSINRIVQFHNKHLLDFAMKKMYTSFVKNCRFTTPSTLPLINFMQRSLVELFSINLSLTYRFAFIYIRQLAIHLRNAITVRKKDTQQVVYNWQYIHSLHFWSRLLAHLHTNSAIKPLLYPLVQVILGSARLVPSARFYPLRFQCVRMLTQLSNATGTFIPILPLVTEIFEMTNFNKKHKNLSFKPFNFACILKFSNSQLEEKAFKDGIIDQIYELLMDYLNTCSHSIAFPELMLPLTVQLRKFVKSCKVANYTKQIKQIVDKVEESVKVIAERRKEASLNLADNKAIEEWERKSKEEGTPLSKYYSTWRKLRDQELQLEVSRKDEISMDNLPVVIRPKGVQKASEQERVEFADIFKSDSEDSDDESRFLLKEERPTKKRKGDEEDSNSSDYSDFNDEELEQLAKSASESEEDGLSGEETDEYDNDDDDVQEDNSSDQFSDEQTFNKQHANVNKNPKKTGIKNEDENIPDKEDIVEDFCFSSSDNDDDVKTKKKNSKKTVKKKIHHTVHKNVKKSKRTNGKS